MSLIQRMFKIKVFVFSVDTIWKLMYFPRIYWISIFSPMNAKKSNLLDFNQKEEVLISQQLSKIIYTYSEDVLLLVSSKTWFLLIFLLTWSSTLNNMDQFHLPDAYSVFLILRGNYIFSVDVQTREHSKIFLVLILKLNVGKSQPLITKNVCLRDQAIQW